MTKILLVDDSKFLRMGWIKAEWGISELGRRARFYRLTGSGRRQLQQEADNWTRVAGAIGKVLELA